MLECQSHVLPCEICATMKMIWHEKLYEMQKKCKQQRQEAVLEVIHIIYKEH